MAKGNKRPLIITLISLVYLVIGLATVLGALGLYSGSIGNADSSELGTIGMLIYGFVVLALFYGFWKGWSVFWYIGVVVTGIGVLLNLIAAFTTGLGALLPFVVEVVVLLYLLKPNVKRFFLD